MIFKSFSIKQLRLLSWWCNESDENNFDAIICDGAVRSGKTVCMSISFILWAFANFKSSDFAICGKTITCIRRNVISPLSQVLKSLGFKVEEKVSKNYIDIEYNSVLNRFYLFGGKDEGSASLIQGMTLSGAMLDEVALMPRSFVEQTIARCSIKKSKLWFNCNPEHPFHWFYLEWIKKATQKKTLYLHFTMEDNPSLSSLIIKRYKTLYTGTFYDRFILGHWVGATGLVFPMFSMEKHIYDQDIKIFSKFYVSCDYGTVNPMSLGLWGENNGVWYRLKEYYYSSKESKVLKTDEEYYYELRCLCENRDIEAIIIDPSAASFSECIKRHGEYKVIKAKNNVVTGIRNVCSSLYLEKIKIHKNCVDSIREFKSYCWHEYSVKDTPKKDNDHAMDDIRYFVNTVLMDNEDPFFVISQKRL